MIAKPVLPGEDVYLFGVGPEDKTERTPGNLEVKGTLKEIIWVEFVTEDTEHQHTGTQSRQ